jgi:D-3-phosphoglycerate dehydrogenase
MDGVLCIPHLGASTEESEDNCAVMAAKQLIQYAENGCIVNSVNAPNCALSAKETKYRLCVLHRNSNELLALLTETINQSMPIMNLSNCVKGELAYSVFDVDNDAIKNLAQLIESWDNVYRVRLV